MIAVTVFTAMFYLSASAIVLAATIISVYNSFFLFFPFYEHNDKTQTFLRYCCRRNLHEMSLPALCVVTLSVKKCDSGSSWEGHSEKTASAIAECKPHFDQKQQKFSTGGWNVKEYANFSFFLFCKLNNFPLRTSIFGIHCASTSLPYKECIMAPLGSKNSVAGPL